MDTNPSWRESAIIFGPDVHPLLQEKQSQLLGTEQRLDDLLELKIRACQSKYKDLNEVSQKFWTYTRTYSTAKLLNSVRKEIKDIKAALSVLENGRNLDWEQRVLQAKAYPIESIFPGTLRKSGKRKLGKCPIHSDKTPSFVVYENNCAHCFGCGWSGDSISLVMALEKLNFKQAVRRLT